MKEIPENVRQEIIKLIPKSLLDSISCFLFYDKHPRHEKNIDITICTKSGELKEYYQRDLLSSLNLHCVLEPTSIKILRNNNSELFYIVTTQDELFIISSKENLQIHKILHNIDRYDVNDTACNGQTYLKVFRKDDAVPIVFDNNFRSLEDQGIILNTQNDDDSLPILIELKRKLVEAKYTTKCNENIYSQYLNLRQKVSMLSFQNLCPDSNDSAFKDKLNTISVALKVKTKIPWVKVCNKKIIIILNVLNDCKETVENIHILLSNATIPSLVYTTILFAKSSTSPFWHETNTCILPSKECALVAVMDLEEIKMTVTSRIELSGSISYIMSSKEYLLPFDDVVVSSLESMGDEFDILSNSKASDHNTILAILATTEKVDLCLRHIKNIDEPEISLLDLFCTHLQMERVGNADNIIVYSKSPYHVLNGTMIVFHESSISEKAVSVSLHIRSSSQVLALLHYIYDAIPAKIVATSPTIKISTKTDELSHYNEEISNTSEEKLNYMDYATSILNRSAKVLEHLDNSMIKMSESKNPSVQSKVGSHIDLFAGGVTNYRKFRESVLDETKQGIDSLIKSDSIDYNMESDVMIID